ncbi:hypothetical protein MYVALT_G_00070 [Candidatus Vallotia tarda]|uniref:Uncharacterized protein n=1 Tax=Candidatus Vallotiella hemipterorum TaxID=1177213 RepID=A0A916JVM0_9BURK|nr:hypothetical protein MYVALT_G_00070 [Candidatus Vallotia tarda]
MVALADELVKKTRIPHDYRVIVKYPVSYNWIELSPSSLGKGKSKILKTHYIIYIISSGNAMSAITPELVYCLPYLATTPFLESDMHRSASD